ncbi:MAG TPA: MoxR family ATPase [Actinomycetota bacterium]|nr:MoxR family ATPase [Actinomycetota bacterium]
MDRPAAVEALRRIVANVESVIVGKHHVVETCALALAAEGHLLIEDAPGVGKTMLAKALAKSIDGTFKRVQATPDLLPSDITGVAIYYQATNEFQFISGPIFANVVVVDEINRTTPRTQAALLEAMEERQVTAEGITRKLPSPFFVMATQNPLEYHGTYPLPEGQLDRFLIATSLGYTDAAGEAEMVLAQLIEHPIDKISPVVSLNEIDEIQARVKETRIEKLIIQYAVAIAASTRSHPQVSLGAGPRGSLGITRVAQSRALLQGRDFVLPDDIKVAAALTLPHRLVLKSQLRMGPGSGKRIVSEVLDKVPVPVTGG